ncbi:MAG TPA: hemerythrin domain-containing protein [Verrucomicrobiae bacterium]|nr:hemerythrin domain-containing protein [Verrucomicrobiae bacterium]
MLIVKTLARDHRALEKILTGLGGTTGADPAPRVEQFTRLQAVLHGHARAEEEVVYRPLRARQPEEEKLLEAFEEHRVADLLLQELASACPGGAGWAARLRVLEEMLRHHIKEEELHLFPLIEESFDEAAQARMSREFNQLKHERVEVFLAPFRRAMPAFAGRAAIGAQAAAGRIVRRGELYVRQRISQMRG